MHNGRCQCRQCTFQFSGKPITCYACHCTDCQSASGSAFGLSMIVMREEIKLIKGNIIEQVFESGDNLLHRHACALCGSAMWYSGENSPEFAAIKAGVFDDKTWFKPVAHVWVKSAQPWIIFDTEIPCYDTQPEIEELAAL